MKTFRILSMAALVAMGAIITGCVKEEPAQSEEIPAVVEDGEVCTTTVSLIDTKALTAGGVKTFAAGEQLAVIYKNKSGTTVKAASVALTADDIDNEGKSATFTVTLNNPDRTQDVTYVYPAWMANTDGTIRYHYLFNNQSGTLANLASQHDYCTNSGAWNAGALPSLSLENQLAILAITLKNGDGSSNLTSDVTGLTISDGTNTYSLMTPWHDTDGHIYVAILPTDNADIEITAKAGAGYYSKTLTDKTYQAGRGYNVSWRMPKIGINLNAVTEDTIAVDGDVLTGTLGKNVKISIAAGATVTLDNASINRYGSWTEGFYAGLTCIGDATIILKDGSKNYVTGFNEQHPGIYVYAGKTLTIQGEAAGTGELTACSNGQGAGIGGGWVMPCGNIVIEGGIIMATGSNYSAGIGGGGKQSSCGNITITGGTITAIGGEGSDVSEGSDVDEQICGGAGIGSCYKGSCGNITITSGVTSVEAWKGPNANCVGAGESGTCGTVTIGGTMFWDGSSFQNGGDTYLTNEKLVFPWVKNVNLAEITKDFTVLDGVTLSGTLGTTANIYIADGATVTLDGVSINDSGSWEEENYAALNCLGDATIILKDGSSNTLKSFHPNYPGIHVPSGSTLTIKGETVGDGSLTASSNGRGAGIGGGPFINCGHIVIEGGTITATGSLYSGGIGGGTEATCGNITITGGTITAVGGDGQDGVYNEFGGAGIGSGSSGSCGDITISSGVTSLVATKGPNANCVGAGESGTCGTVTIGGTVFWDGSSFQNGGDAFLTTSPLIYPRVGEIELSQITENFTVPDGTTLFGALANPVKISIADGATVTLDFVTINGIYDSTKY